MRREMAYRLIGVLAVSLGLSGCYVESDDHESIESELSITDALKKCLTGRCKLGEKPAPGQMPPYNLGTGYTCDVVRWQVYADCMGKPGATKEACLKLADDERDKCKKSPCAHVYKQCKDHPCKKTTNSWDCWRRVKTDGGETKEFGYWEWDDVKKEWYWVPIKGDAVSEAEWEKHCRAEEKRCQAGIDAKPGDKVPPISKSFCSAACNGHNCHHAAEQVCKCLEKESGDAKPRIVVLDGESKKYTCPDPLGNVYHSMVTVQHPTNPAKRCLIESQVTCGTPSGVDEKCCYKDYEEWKKLADNGCKLVLNGPFDEKMTLDPISTYTCDEFLKKRGTCESELPPHKTEVGALEKPACTVVCSADGLVPAIGESVEACPDGYTCSVPDSVTCDICEAASQTCDSATGECPMDTPLPTYRGECVPIPVPDGGVDGGGDLVTPAGDLVTHDATPIAPEDAEVDMCVEDAAISTDGDVAPGADLVVHTAEPI